MKQLRPYQQQANDAIARKYASGFRRIVFQLPTGGGKTITASALIYRYLQSVKKKVLFVVHREELLNQFRKAIYEQYGLIAEPIVAGVKYRNPNSDIYVTMVETANNRLRKTQKWFGDVGLIIIDEAHLGNFKKLHSYFTAPETLIVGLTATPISSSKKHPLKDDYQDIICSTDIPDLIAIGALVPNRTFHVKNSVNPASLKIKNGEFDTEAMFREYSKGKHIENCIRGYEEHAAGSKTLVFNCNVEHSKMVDEAFRSHGYDSRHLDGTMPDSVRKEILRWFSCTPGAILNNIGILTAGFDEPSVETVIMNRSTLSLPLWIQCLDTKTEILTKDGFKKHNEVNSGDIVASFNPENGEIEFIPCENKFERPLGAGEKMYSISSPFIDFRVTGGHNLLQRTRSRNEVFKNFKLTEASDVAKIKQGYEMPIAGQWNNGKGIDLSDSQIMLLGWWLSDGTIEKTNRITISQSTGQPKWLHDSIIKCIEQSGYKYRINRVKRKGALSKYPDLIQYRICAGAPRGIDKHLKGCADMLEYFDKNISDKLFSINKRQLLILLKGLQNGDGSKQKTAYWNPKSLSISAGDNKIFAERIQMLCILNNIKCNISKHDRDGQKSGIINSKKKIFILRIKDRNYASIKGCNEPLPSNPIKESPTIKGEKVWCCSTKYETLITRRNGKVVIMGNCTGRGSRPFPGKTHFTIIDMGGNALQHGDWSTRRDWNHIFHNPPVPGKGGGVAPVKECISCESIISATATTCRFCGAVQPAAEVNYDKEAVEFELLESAIPVQAIIQQTKQLGHNPYAALHRAKELIISNARQHNSTMNDTIAYNLLGLYQEKVQEWCHVMKRNYDQWHKETTAEWFFDELKRQFGWERPRLKLAI